MKNIQSVTNELYKIFELYMNKGITNFSLVQRLETQCKGKGNKSYWWRFFDNDTAANDANSVNESLQSIKNTEYLKECITICLAQRSLIVFYS